MFPKVHRASRGHKIQRMRSARSNETNHGVSVVPCNPARFFVGSRRRELVIVVGIEERPRVWSAIVAGIEERPRVWSAMERRVSLVAIRSEGGGIKAIARGQRLRSAHFSRLSAPAIPCAKRGAGQ
jgi:hypothetical protein